MSRARGARGGLAASIAPSSRLAATDAFRQANHRRRPSFLNALRHWTWVRLNTNARRIDDGAGNRLRPQRRSRRMDGVSTYDRDVARIAARLQAQVASDSEATRRMRYSKAIKSDWRRPVV